jgi:hypothetical protein
MRFLSVASILAVLGVALGAKLLVYPTPQAEAKNPGLPSAAIELIGTHGNEVPQQQITDRTFVFPE